MYGNYGQPWTQYPQYQEPRQQLVKVTGMEGARAYQMPPNSVAPLFDANEDILYVKSTDGAGFPTIRRFSFAPMPDGDVSAQYVTRVEFDRAIEGIREAMSNARQPVPEQPQQS